MISLLFSLLTYDCFTEQGWTVQLMVKRTGLGVEQFKDDVQEFKPSRWLESNGQPLKNNPKGFMPFGGVSRTLQPIIPYAVCHAPVLCRHSRHAHICRLLAASASKCPLSPAISHFLQNPHARWSAYSICGLVKLALLSAGTKDLPGHAAGKDGDARSAGTAVSRVPSGAGRP